ncbi:MAG: tripartite tricarboxylate transporter substrate binding protein [Alcaligenaceae bacterium]|nr:tripartite tricarboxylate transporter substrate binding protein [Alcaligenaceae bacterium]
MKRIIASILIGISGLAACASASAQVNYPSKPITIVLPFGPGSGTDIATRLIAQKLSENLKISVVVENKPGANGSIAAEHVAKSKPDGYTLMMGTNSTHGANPALLKDIRYDPIKDFEHINRIVVFTSIVAVNPKLPVKTMKELIEYGPKQ